jgi:superfamily I DNA/RNA helicase
VGKASSKEITAAIFFELVDEVLRSLGREGLARIGPQRAVIEVTPTDRVLQILAGPGSGKTEMLAWRVLYELFVARTAASRVIVTTFTRRAATELQVRVVERADEFSRLALARGYNAIDPHVHDLRIGTIHSLCDALLAEFDPAYMEAGSELIDEIEAAIRLSRQWRFALHWSKPPQPPRLVNRLRGNEALVALFRASWYDVGWPARNMEMVEFLSALLAQQTETWFPRCGPHNSANGIELVHGPRGLTSELLTLQQRWESYLDAENILDFATVQKRFVERQLALLDQFDHIFVDEFQDNNPIQFSIHTRWLDNPKSRLTVVGDDDQAIYRFRGSDIECFRGLEPYCRSRNIAYRRETLGVNYRSTQRIVKFCHEFKDRTVLRRLSMPKHIVPSPAAVQGSPVRMLQGPWAEVCRAVAVELDGLRVGRVPAQGAPPVPSVAILLFSTSEREGRGFTSPAVRLRTAVEARGMRVYNPRNKMAASPESPVGMLMGLISYLIDPVTYARAGQGGRRIMVWASMQDNPTAATHARTAVPSFQINGKHIEYQKKFMKAGAGDIGAPAPDRRRLVQFVDDVRDQLARIPTGQSARLTLAGFVARLLADPFFRACGFTNSLFRQALFTDLLEANIAPTRLTGNSLDLPLEVALRNGKFVWATRHWELLNHFGGYLDNYTLDDPDVESFEDDAVLMVTFHQAKGLEFDHIYVAGTGRDPDISPALRTRLFSGEAAPYVVSAGRVSTSDATTLDLALADREREVYVALTRAKATLTILHDPASVSHFMRLHPALEPAFARSRPQPHPANPNVEVKEAPV